MRPTNITVETFDIGNLISKKQAITLTYSKNYSSNETNNLNTSIATGNTTSINASSVDYLTIPSNRTLHVKGNLVVDEDLTMAEDSTLIVDGSIRVNGTATLSGTLTLTNQNKFVYISGDRQVLFWKVKVKVPIKNLNLIGEMYINSTSDITKNLNTNSSIYVKDGVNVTGLANTGGTLILLSDGNIQVSNIYENNNEFYDAPTVLNAFFYSNQTLEIYGIGSNSRIEGGIYGRDIILNAVNGRTEPYNWSTTNSSNLVYDRNGNSLNHTNYYDTNQNPIDPITKQYDPTKTRLSIIYQKDIIANPPTGIPTAQALTVKEIDTVYE